MSGTQRAIGWDAFLLVREQDRRAALLAAHALVDGQIEAAASLLGSWRFGHEPALTQALLRVLAAQPPSPSGMELARGLAPGELLPRTGRLLAPWQHRVWLAAQSIPTYSGASVEQRLAWGLVELRTLGREVQDRIRAPWLRQPMAPELHDAEMPQLWLGLRPPLSLKILNRWQSLFLPSALAAVRGVLDASGWPRGDWSARLAYEEESFLVRLLGHRSDDGWRVLAGRVIETGPDAPMVALSAPLDQAAQSQAARCAVRRGHGWATAEGLWPDARRARVMAERLGAYAATAPGALEALAELHVAMRLLHYWSRGEQLAPLSSWRVVSQNLGRARGRLRSVLRRVPDATLLATVLAQDQLAARTRVAVTRMWRDIAWTELRKGWPGDVSLDVEADCDETRIEGGEDDTDGLLGTWVLLVILRGCLAPLRRWVETGSGDKGGTWGRLLADELPDALRAGMTRMDGITALRERLHRDLRKILHQLRPSIMAVAQLDPDQSGLALAVRSSLEPVWDPAMSLPAARHRKLIEHAAAALPLLLGEECTE